VLLSLKSYRALKEAGVQLTRQDREHFYLLARDLLESRKTRHARQSDEEWHALYAHLAAIDGLPATKDNLMAPKAPQRSRVGPIPRREIGHLLGRETWLASMIDLLAKPRNGR
jgi:hypothetical protein